jgi:glycine cleavage system transcriptional repressor
MSVDQSQAIYISITAPDRVGLISAITARLFDLGANLADTSFAVLGTGCEFTAVCSMSNDTSPADIASDLGGLPELAAARIKVEPFDFEATQAPNAQITHRVEITGGDRPGLVARLTEAFLDYDANVVRMNSVHVPGEEGSHKYVTRFAVYIPPARAASCLAAISNTAQQLECTCSAKMI